MPKLYTHSRLIDLEFQHLYKEIDNQIETIVKEGLSGPQGKDGPDGNPGSDGLDSTLKLLTKYYVTVGYGWRKGFSNVAIDATYSSPLIWDIKSQASADAEYLSKDYFIPNEFTTRSPLFIFTKKTIIQRVYIHLIEPFFASNTTLSTNAGVGVYLVSSGKTFNEERTQIAWSGLMSRFCNTAYTNILASLTPPYFNELAKMCPRPIIGADSWEEPHLITEFASLIPTEVDPDLSASSNPLLRRAWGTGHLYLEAGTQLFIGDIPTLSGWPGFAGPVELQPGEGIDKHDYPVLRLLPEATFPLGGGCAAITVIYHEVD